MSLRGPKLIALFAGFWLCGCGSRDRDTVALREQVAEAVPLGSGATQVIAYLDTEKSAHSVYKRDPVRGNVIEAVMVMQRQHALVQPDYDVIFQFDDRDHLTRYEVGYLGCLCF